ncbi:hypothetical protein [Pseudanabaena yagii]|uniref:Uncharacterized protein n=1 Tax=Pseudanabaena yagii GIHE-NHR1 TaxID=2722753 RepID=A0ABX1LVI0_9CYAN|nr:hypothetical protein [Pseudanabaena yagii]NMF60172.1 hypothetical protein [Pseudanabaena yagii GIHE-NHR1]
MESKKLTKQQKRSRRSLKNTIPLAKLTHDEVYLITALLSNWKASFDSVGNAKLIEKKIKVAPFAMGEANFCQLVYKLENFVNPKTI